MLTPDPPVAHHNPPSLRLVAHNACPSCHGTNVRTILRIKQIPTNSCLMLETPAEALAFPKGDIDLTFCQSCGFIFNAAFDPLLTEYSERYEPTQAYSPTFLRFQSILTDRIIEACALRGKTVVEVGCAQGDFLHLLCKRGGNAGIGFDPCLDARREDQVQDRAEHVRLIGDFFSETSVTGLSADAVVSKMTLEHIPAVDKFAGVVAQVARQSAPGMRIFIQIPESERILKSCAFEDIYYEHCNYFTEASLKGLFSRHGFGIDDLYRDYDGQYLSIIGHYAGTTQVPGRPDEIARLQGMAETFAHTVDRKIRTWRSIVDRRSADGAGVVIWGSGSKGVSFLSALKDCAAITHVVDINPHRQGKYMVGSGLPIIGPAALKDIKPATVIVMNAVYQAEIAATLASLNLTPELMTL